MKKISIPNLTYWVYQQVWDLTIYVDLGYWSIPHFLGTIEPWITYHENFFLYLRYLRYSSNTYFFRFSWNISKIDISGMVPHKNMIDTPLIPPCVIIEYPTLKYFFKTFFLRFSWNILKLATSDTLSIKNYFHGGVFMAQWYLKNETSTNSLGQRIWSGPKLVETPSMNYLGLINECYLEMHRDEKGCMEF